MKHGKPQVLQCYSTVKTCGEIRKKRTLLICFTPWQVKGSKMTKQEAQSEESMTAVADERFRWIVQKIEICSIFYFSSISLSTH